MSHIEELYVFNDLPQNGVLTICDFSKVDRKYRFTGHGGFVELGEQIVKETIESVDILQKILFAITESVQADITHNKCYLGEININDYFIYQLVFDVLFDKYYAESPVMTLTEYCNKHVSFGWDKGISNSEISSPDYDLNDDMNAIYHRMYNQLKEDYEINCHDEIKETYSAFGVKSDYYDACLNYLKSLHGNTKENSVKPKYYWDAIYYNAHPRLITYRQYRRNLQTDKHYSYAMFDDDYRTYDKFVNKFMTSSKDTPVNRFEKTMDFYHLEMNKRLDFIYKLAVKMECAGLEVIDKTHCMIKRFHPVVEYLSIENDHLCTTPRHKYYRPFLFVDKAVPECEQPEKLTTGSELIIYYIIRARVYELFNYKFRFSSNNYDDIMDFITKHFNVLSYHDPNKVWFTTDSQKKRDSVKRIKNAVAINHALFWESDARQKPSRQKRTKTETE